MTHEEKGLLTNYLVDAGEIDPDGDVEAQFLEWYQVREGVVSGETHYKAVLEAGRVRKRSFERGSSLAAVVRAVDGEPLPSGDGRGFCDHDTPCSCYAEGYATGRGERHEKTPVDFSKLHRVLDHIYRATEEGNNPLSGLVAWQSPPGHWDGATSIDHTCHQAVGPVSLHCRVQRHRQLVRFPPFQHRPEPRSKARLHLQLPPAGAGLVAPIVQPFPEILTQVIPLYPHRKAATHHRKGGDHGVLATASGQDGPIHPKGESGELRLAQMR